MRGHVGPAPMRVDVNALAGFLDTLDFTYFCTFTTRRPISLNSSRRIAEKVARYVDAGNTSTMFWASEKFDVREGFHFHALLETPVHSLDIFNWYFSRFGRCQIIDNRQPDRQLAASYYVSKYCSKELTDYDMYFAKGVQMRNQQTFKFSQKIT